MSRDPLPVFSAGSHCEQFWHAHDLLSHKITMTAVLFHTALCSTNDFHTRSRSYWLLSPMQWQTSPPSSQRTSTKPCGPKPSSAASREGMAVTVPGLPWSCTQTPLFTVHLSLLFICHLYHWSSVTVKHCSLIICHCHDNRVTRCIMILFVFRESSY